MPNVQLSFLSESVRLRARATALRIADEIAAEPNVMWRGISGCAGDAIVHWAALHATGDARYERAMHESLARAARFDGPAEMGLYTGLSGLRAAAALALQFEPRYAGLVERCDDQIERLIPASPKKPERFYEFDVIAGLAGVRLARAIDGPIPMDRTVELLAWLVEDWDRWQCPHPDDPERVPVHDMGMAHGIAGVLSTIALTCDDESLRDRVLTCARRVLASQRRGSGYPAWPHSLELEDDGNYRNAWCYGTAGVTAALHAVGMRFGDSALQTAAFDAAFASDRAGMRRWRLHELGICHGFIGNALCFASIAANAQHLEFSMQIERLVVSVLDALDRTLGICYSRRDGEKYATTNELTGSGGIALALLTLSGAAPSQWMRIHALSPV